MSSARSRISMSSQLMYGSHSAPFSSNVSGLTLRADSSFAASGKTAPPKTDDAAEGERCAQVVGGRLLERFRVRSLDAFVACDRFRSRY